MKLDFCEVFDDCTSRCKKIPKEEYLAEGKNIVIDQGQNIIAGYTNVEDGLFEDIPAIVFGDHTRIIKYVDKPFFLGADGVKLLKSKINGANYKYLYYVLSNEKIPDTGYNRHFKWLKEISLEYKDVESQKKIVRTLDSVTKIIELCKIELRKLDNLIKARFVEIFGDLKLNSKGWEIKPFEDLTDLITDGEHITPRRVEKGIYLLSARNVLNHSFQLDDVDYIDQEEYDRIAKRITPQEGDVLISCSGTVGRCCSVPAYMKFQMVRSAALLRFKKEINPVFAEYMITSDYLQEQINSSKTASSQANLFQGKIAKLKGFVPPRNLQDEFLTFVAQIDKSKFPTLHNHKSIYTKSQLCCKMVIVNVFLNTKRFWINKTLRIFSLR